MCPSLNHNNNNKHHPNLVDSCTICASSLKLFFRENMFVSLYLFESRRNRVQKLDHHLNKSPSPFFLNPIVFFRIQIARQREDSGVSIRKSDAKLSQVKSSSRPHEKSLIQVTRFKPEYSSPEEKSGISQALHQQRKASPDRVQVVWKEGLGRKTASPSVEYDELIWNKSS